MALLKVKNPRTLVVSQFVVFIVAMSLIDLFITDDSVASALIKSVATAILAACLWWLARRSRN